MLVSFYDRHMQVTLDVLESAHGSGMNSISWDFQSAVGALAATASHEVSDKLLMTLLATAVDQQTLNHLFEEVFNRYHQQVKRWCYKLSKDQDRASDLTQEVFLKVFRSLHTFRGDSQLSTWLYVITRNHCLNSLKKWKSEPDGHVVEMQPAVARAVGEDVQLAIERAQSYQQVFCLLRSILTPMEVKVMILHYVHDWTLPAITRQLMLSNRSGAKAYLVSARRKLKFLAEDYSQYGDKLSTYVGDFVNRRTAA